MEKANGLEVILDIDANIPSVLLGDGRKIKKILRHLIDNAIKFTKKGAVYVRVYAMRKSYGINLCMKVCDTGIGIDEENLEKITEKFFQSDGSRSRRTGGLGLGLSIVYGMVAAMEGFIQIESTVGSKTTVSVSIPQKIAEDSPCMSVTNRARLCLACYLRPEKYEIPEVRDYYNEMISHMICGLDLSVHRVFNLDEMKALTERYQLSHLFIGREEYEESIDYFESLDENIEVVVTADDSFVLPQGSRLHILRKPFYSLSVINILNSEKAESSATYSKERMICPDIRVLVVDDEPMNLMVAEGLFKDYQMQVTTAGGGTEAIELCKKEDFDLIFLDHMMPDMDGVETLKQLRKIFADSGSVHTIIAFTANAVSGAREMFLREGFDEFVSKPIEHLEMERVLKKVLPMGGDIAVNSVYTKGSTFVITLPQKIVDETEIGELNLESRHTLNAREHYKHYFEAPRAQVLIVDDNEMNLMVAEKLLRDTKVKISTATSGKECLKKTLQDRYDVILMDHLMPEMDGIECLHAIRSQTGGLNHSTPVAVLTANAGGENQELYRREGFDGYLLKPISGTKLEMEVFKHLPRELVSVTNSSGDIGVVETPVLAHNTKMRILISTDSVCDIPEYLTKKFQIAVMPYRVITEGGEFLDGVEAETEGILSYIGVRGKQARSKSPEVADYEDFFAEQLTKAQYVIHITMAQNASQGYANALEVSKTFDNVIVVDSGHLSSGMGLMVLRAAQFAADGLAPDEIVNELMRMRRRVRTSFIVDSTEYMARSGKISSKINTICQVLMLHPVIVLKKSSMKVGTIRIGTKDFARRKYITSTLNVMGEIDNKLLFITYTGMKREELKEIERQVKEKVTFENIIYQKASPAISSNCGPGTFGLLFMLKE